MSAVVVEEVAVSERSPDHNPDIAIDLHLQAAESAHADPVTGRRDKIASHEAVVDGTLGAIREVQLWVRTINEQMSATYGRLDGVDGRLRRLEAAASADDLALDDLRELIEDLRIEFDAAVEQGQVRESET